MKPPHADNDWVYFEGNYIEHFTPIQWGDQLHGRANEEWRDYQRDDHGLPFSGTHPRRRPRRNCTPEQLALAGVRVEPPTYEHYL